jgi:hypothetical protein
VGEEVNFLNRGLLIKISYLKVEVMKTKEKLPLARLTLLSYSPVLLQENRRFVPPSFLWLDKVPYKSGNVANLSSGEIEPFT